MAAFRFRHQLQARFRDCDLFGHVNNAVYFTYMEEARWAYWRELTGDFPHDRLPGLIADLRLVRVAQRGVHMRARGAPARAVGDVEERLHGLEYLHTRPVARFLGRSNPGI